MQLARSRCKWAVNPFALTLCDSCVRDLGWLLCLEFVICLVKVVREDHRTSRQEPDYCHSPSPHAVCSLCLSGITSIAFNFEPTFVTSFLFLEKKVIDLHIYIYLSPFLYVYVCNWKCVNITDFSFCLQLTSKSLFCLWIQQTLKPLLCIEHLL